MPLVDDLEREQEFLAEFFLALADIGLRREHPHGVVGQLVGAVGGLARPDREHHIRRHAELALDPGERRAVLYRQPLALLGEPRNRRLGNVVRR